MTTGLSHRATRLIGVLAAALIALSACNNSSPASATPSSAAWIPPVGAVDIGDGRHLEIACKGTSGPTVLFLGGLGNTFDVWSAVQSRVSTFAFACAYNRAGLGRSDARPSPHGVDGDVDDLHRLVEAARVPGPLVLVGASYGGLDAQRFAIRYPQSVAGVVLVDSIASGWDPALEALLTPAQVAERRAIPNGEPISNEDIRAGEAALADTDGFPAVPLVVIRHGLPFDGGPDWPTEQVEQLWSSLQEGLTRLSPRSALLLADASGHRIHQQQPDLVAMAIRSVVDPTAWPPAVPSAPPAFGTDAPPAAGGLGAGVLVFARSDGIHEAAGDGSRSHLIVRDDSFVLGSPSVDARATRIAYTQVERAAQPSGPQEEIPTPIWVRSLETGKALLVAQDGALPKISPDGRNVAYTVHGRAFVVRSDGTNGKQLGDGSCTVWSPDSSRLACGDADGNLFIIRPDDGATEAVSTGPGPNEPAAWSPDGKRIAFGSSRDGDGEVYVVDLDGSGERRVTTAPGNQWAELWTSAGLIVTSSQPNAETSDWFLVDPETGAATSLAWLSGAFSPISYAPEATYQ